MLDPWNPNRSTALRGLVPRARRRGASRRHGVRRCSSRGALDRTGQERRLLHGDQREAGSTGWPRTSAAPSARPSRSRRPTSSASTWSTSSASRTASSSTACPAPRYRRGGAGHKPEIVITGNFRDTWGGRNLNQADHIAVGRAVVDAVRDAGNRWIFNDQLTGDLEPWGGVREVWAFGSPRPRTASTPPRPSTPASSRSGRTRRTSRASAGRTSPPRVAQGLRSAGRPAARGGVRGAVRGVPMGWGE